jgi:hypothetical protein
MLSQLTTAFYAVKNMTTVRGGSRTTYLAGEIAQCDFWFPPIKLPVGFGQTRTASQLPVLTMITGYARWALALLLPTRQAEDLYAGWWRLLQQLERSFLPGRTFTSPTDFNTQLQAWLGMANQRRKRSLGCAPAERIGADEAAMLALPPVPPTVGWENTLRLPRDHYVRLGSNDYSVHPTAIGRRVLVRADLDRVRVWCEGRAAAATAAVRPSAAGHRNGGGTAPSHRLRHRAGRGRIRGAGGIVMSTKTARDMTAEITYLTRALKAPTLRESGAGSPSGPGPNLGAMRNIWRPVLQREVAARDAHGGEGRIRAARFPARKSIEGFDFEPARGLKRDLIAHLATLDIVTGKENVIFVGPPGPIRQVLRGPHPFQAAHVVDGGPRD